jgi:NADH-quinone oxidoreductase subunit M
MFEAADFPLLTLFTFAPVIGMVVILLLPSRSHDIIKTVASAFAAVPMLLGLYILLSYKDTGLIQYRESLPWIETLNVRYTLGIDGLSSPMIVLSGIVGFLAVVASWGIEKQVKGYFALILLLLTGMNGVFCALDFFLFYVFWELMLLPMYFLIGIWGGPKRVYAAIKFFLYTMAGSVLMLVVLLACWYWSDGRYESDMAKVRAVKARILERRVAAAEAIEDLSGQRIVQRSEMKRRILTRYGIDVPGKPDEALDAAVAIHREMEILAGRLGRNSEAMGRERARLLDKVQLTRTFDLLELKERYTLFLGSFRLFDWSFFPTLKFATLMFIFLYIAFAIKVPVFPFHTWLPWAHVEAPTAISVILAGILLKMGVYGFFRLSYSIFPTEAIAFAVPIGAIGVFNIIYGACCAMAQDDMKKLVAYSSVSHMGFCMLGMAALTQEGMTGSILQMFNHGTSTSMMFLLVGVIYDRAHHRDINRFGGLAKALPVYAGVMTLALFASLGLPGLSGFISEVMVFIGSFRSSMGEVSDPNWSFQSMTVIAAFGVVLTAAYLLWMLQRVFFGPLNEKYKDYQDMTGRELFSLAPLCVMVVVFGVCPQPLINLTQTTVGKLQAFVAATDERVGDAVMTTVAHTPRPDDREEKEAHAPREGASPPATGVRAIASERPDAGDSARAGRVETGARDDLARAGSPGGSGMETE